MLKKTTGAATAERMARLERVYDTGRRCSPEHGIGCVDDYIDIGSCPGCAHIAALAAVAELDASQVCRCTGPNVASNKTCINCKLPVDAGKVTK